jgi:hypothetical protein
MPRHLEFANDVTTTEDYFEVRGISMGCFDDGGMAHISSDAKTTEHVYADSLVDLIRQTDQRRKDAEKWRCRSCRRGGWIMTSVMHYHRVITTAEITPEQRIQARRRLQRQESTS